MTRTFPAYVTGIGLGLSSLFSLFGCESNKRYLHVVFEREDLASDGGEQSYVTDPNLVNPMGLQISPSASFWVANNATGTATVYRRDGTPLPDSDPMVVTLPAPPGAEPGAIASVTGVSYFDGAGLEIANGEQRGSARLLFTTREGTILGYNPQVDPRNAVIAVDNSASGAAYRGLSVVPFASGGRVYATNFGARRVDVFDPAFAPATDLDPAAFEDLELPADYAPFGIQRFERVLYVSYAERDAAGRDPVTGPGKGYINAFALNGEFVRRIASEGELNAPWGMARVPWSFPYFGGSLLAGNAGDGRIHAFDLWDLTPLGSLNDLSDQALAIDGLWDLVFGYDPDGYLALYFTAGPNGGQNGSFGRLNPQILEVDPPSGE